MACWAVDESILTGNKFTITRSRGFAHIHKGDDVIFFHKHPGVSKFSSHSNVVSVRQDRKSESENAEYYTIGMISENIPIENPLSTSDLAYSLERVYRYNTPYRHFSNQYIKLSREDYETIISGLIFWSRTAVGMFINELQKEQLNRFIQELAQIDPESLIPAPNYYRIWQVLNDFIREEFVGAARLLKEIHSLVDTLGTEFNLGLEYTKLGLSSDDYGEADLLHKQEEVLSKFISSIKSEKQDILQELTINIEQSETELRFQKIFGGMPWPLHEIRL